MSKHPTGDAAVAVDDVEFRAFFASQYARLCWLGYLLSGNRAEAEELAQDALDRWHPGLFAYHGGRYVCAEPQTFAGDDVSGIAHCDGSAFDTGRHFLLFSQCGRVYYASGRPLPLSAPPAPAARPAGDPAGAVSSASI